MTIRFDQKLLQEILLLKGTVDNQGILEEKGICTETGPYDCTREDAIYDYRLPNEKSPLSREDNTRDLIINETQQKIDASSISEDRSAIQLTPQSWLESVANDPTVLQQFNNNFAKLRVIYEFERNSIVNAKTVLVEKNTGVELNALNDLLDICVKSQFKKSVNNYNIPGNLIFSGVDTKANSNIDIYLEFDSYPIDFCQSNNGAFVLSQPTARQPYMLKSDLDSQQQTMTHHFQLESKLIQTVLYKGVDCYSLSATSYAQALSSQASSYGSQLSAMQLFEPHTKVTGIDYNYVVGIEQMDDSSRTQSNQTIYGNGDIYGSMALTKSMYNALYSMDMPSSGMLQNCRQYCGIQSSQGKVLLKYYDNVDYRFDQCSSNSGGEVAAEKSNMASKKYPYQKVEFFQPNKMAPKTRHKSNLFSIKLYNTGLDDESVVDNRIVDQKIAEQVKRDIFNGVKALADSIAPASTQLFKTYYMPPQN